MSHRISVRVVKAIKCSLYCNTVIEALLYNLYLNTLAIVNEILRRYCTVRIFGVESVEIIRFT